MKKNALIILLVVLLISLLSSGSLALYTQTQELRGQISTRVLILKANEKNVSYELGLDGLALAPGELKKDLYRFSITNASGADSVCDYTMSVSISSQGMAQAISAMNGLTFSLYDASLEGGSPIAIITGGELNVTNIIFPMGVRKTAEYLLTASWADTGDSAGQTAVAMSGARFPVKLTITGRASN